MSISMLRVLLLALVLVGAAGCADFLASLAPQSAVSSEAVDHYGQAETEDALPKLPKSASTTMHTEQEEAAMAPESAMGPRHGRSAGNLPPVLPTTIETTSTFGLDADDAAWHIALAQARAGRTLEPDAVRVEEWLQALEWDYAVPEAPATWGLDLTVTPDPLDADSVLVLMGLAAAAPADLPEARHVTLVLDASGSMSEDNKIDTGHALVAALLERLDHTDRVSIVQYSSYVLYEHLVAHAAPDAPVVARSLQAWRPSDSTNAEAGLREGFRLAAEGRDRQPSALHYLVFVSDGVANVGDTRPEAILEAMGKVRAAANPIRVVSLGVGIANYNDHLLEQVSNDGDGWYRYVQGREEALGLMAADSFAKLFTPAADEARVQVTWDTETVESWRLLGYRNRAAANETFEDDTEDFAEIHMGQEVTVVYRLALLPQAEAPAGELRLRWHHPGTGTAQTQTWMLDGAVTEWDEVPTSRRLALLVALAGENAAEPLADAQSRRTRITELLAAMQDMARSSQGQAFAEVLAASLPPAPAWFEQGEQKRTK